MFASLHTFYISSCVLWDENESVSYNNNKKNGKSEGEKCSNKAITNPALMESNTEK